MRSSSRAANRKSDVDERTLVKQAAGGDARAFAELYTRYQPYVAKIVSGDVGDASAWGDIEQGVFERAWTKLGDLRDPGSFRPWLAQITRRLIVDHHRAVVRTLCRDFTDGENDIDGDDWTPHDWATVAELTRTIKIAIGDLSPRDATVIELATTFGFNANEIGAALNVEPTHARVLVHRARTRLSNALVDIGH